MPMADGNPDGTKRDLVVNRVFDAPIEQVWHAWTDPEHVMSWWGPTGFTSPIARMDFREGGTSLVCMRSPERHDLYNTWTYREILPMADRVRPTLLRRRRQHHRPRHDGHASGHP